MTECSSEHKVVICSENLSDDYRITTEEILSHAKKLGVDYANERHLLPIVLKGLIHPLPPDWIPCYDKERNEFFYYNVTSGTSQWEHPIDEYYRNLITKIRNEGDANSSDFLKSAENSEMLPLRQNKKPQLLPIKQLLKYKDEERTISDIDSILRSDLQSSLRTKNESSSGYKKSVSFNTNKLRSFSEKKSDFFNDDNDNKISKKRVAWNSEISESRAIANDIMNLYNHSSSDSDDDSENDKIFRLNKNHNSKSNSITNTPSSSLKRRSYHNKSSPSEPQSQNSSKRLQINLRHPDPFVFSDSNRDDTIKNILTESVSSEMASEEETPPNVTNVTESGIDVNTVTDLQKLKAKGMINNQNNNVSERQILDLKNFVNEAMAELRQDLNSKFEAKIIAEITKLKKLHQEKVENESNSTNNEKQKLDETLINEVQESLQLLRREIEKKLKKNDEEINTLKSTHNLDIGNLDKKLMEYSTITNNKHECTTNLDTVRKELESSIEVKLNNIEQGLMKKIETLEINHRKEIEKIKFEKEKISEQLEQFKTIVAEECGKHFKKIWEENSAKGFRSELQNILADEMSINDPLFESLKKIIDSVLNQMKKKSADVDRKTIATQTENAIDKEEIAIVKEKIGEISSAVKLLTKEMEDFKRFEDNEVFMFPKQYRDLNSFKDKKDPGNRSLSSISFKMDSRKTNFTPFEDFSSDIDKELEGYRRKYLSNAKLLMPK